MGTFLLMAPGPGPRPWGRAGARPGPSPACQGVLKAQKSSLKSPECQLLGIFFCNPSHTKCLFLEPGTSRFRPYNRFKKCPGNKHEQKHRILTLGAQKAFKLGSQNHPKSIKIRFRTPRCPSCCCHGLPGCSKVPISCAKVQKWGDEGATNVTIRLRIYNYA